MPNSKSIISESLDYCLLPIDQIKELGDLLKWIESPSVTFYEKKTRIISTISHFLRHVRPEKLSDLIDSSYKKGASEKQPLNPVKPFFLVSYSESQMEPIIRKFDDIRALEKFLNSDFDGLEEVISDVISGDRFDFNISKKYSII